MDQIAALTPEGPKTPAISASGDSRRLPASSWPWLIKTTVVCAMAMAVLVSIVMITADKSRNETAMAIKASPDGVAKVLRRTHDGVFCVTSTYNNATAEFNRGKIERCESASRARPRANTMMNWQGN